MADKERRSSPLVLAGDALLLLCALLGLTGSFLSLYGNPSAPLAQATALDRCAANWELFFLCSALFALLSLAAWSLPRFRTAAAGTLSALWTGAVLLHWTEVIQGAGITARVISTQFSRRVAWGSVFAYDPGLAVGEERASVQLFLILALAGLALLLGWTVVRTRCWWLAMEFTLPFLLPGLLADLYPDWPSFMALTACWCVMLITGLCRGAAPSARGKLTLVVFPAAAAVLAIITLAFPREGYTRPPWALKAQEELMNLTSRTSGFFSQWNGPFKGPAVTYVGAAEEVDLAHAGPLNRSGRTVLRVTSDYDGRLYLRGSSLAVYEDGVWKALPEEAYQEYQDYLGTLGGLSPQPDTPLLFPTWTKENLRTHTATVDNVGAVGACVYTPYFLTEQDWAEAGMLPVEDSYLARKQGQWVHTVEFADTTPYFYSDIYVNPSLSSVWPPPEGGDSGEPQTTYIYRDYVYQHYLDVPEELLDALEEICWMIDQSDLGGYNYHYDPVMRANQVAQYLDTLCEYDPDTPAAPEGVDPVLYFLTESHQGYCMHYASAAALLLRYVGVPARYVSGFAADSVPNRQVDVPDRAAHAWVEVWVDGFGWYPVEVTPAAAFDFMSQGAVGDPDQELSAPPKESEAPGPTDDPAPSHSLPGGVGDGPGGTGGPMALPVPVKVLLWAVGAAAAIWLAQFLLKRLRARRMAGPDVNRAALVCYGYLCRLERWGGRMDDRAVELAQKARFSQHTLTEDERKLLRGLVDRERTRLCVTPGLPKRLVFRCLWGMPNPPVSLADETPPENAE